MVSVHSNLSSWFQKHKSRCTLSPIWVNTSASFTWSHLAYHSHCSPSAVGCPDWDRGDAGHRPHTYRTSTQQDNFTSFLEDPSFLEPRDMPRDHRFGSPLGTFGSDCPAEIPRYVCPFKIIKQMTPCFLSFSFTTSILYLTHFPCLFVQGR